MKNFVQAGVILSLSAPYAVASGDGLLVGSIFGVATNAAANGAPVEAYVGPSVMALSCLSTDTGTVGAKMYWDNTNKRLTTTVGANSLVGVLVVAKLAAETTATIRLNGVSV